MKSEDTLRGKDTAFNLLDPICTFSEVGGFVRECAGGRMFAWALNGNDIDGNSVSCTGVQIASVLDLLRSVDALRSATWYAGGLDAIGGPQFQDHMANHLSRVTNLSDLIASLRSKPQLMDGVFLASDTNHAPSLSGKKLTTSCPIGRLSEFSIVELVAFDTAWIEIYTDQVEIIDLLRTQYGGKSL